MSRRRSAGRALPLAVAAACAALTVGLVVGAAHRDRVDPAATTLVPVATQPPEPAPLVLPERPRVLLMGDSYSEGWGADPQTNGFAYQVAEPLGWDLVRDGIGSTGFVDVGLKNQGSYPTRLARHQPANSFDLVILQGGTNDEKLTTAEITAGVDTSVKVVRERFPRAQLLVMGPVAPYGSPSEDRAKLNLALVDYTHEHSILYINAIAGNWFQVGEWRELVDQEKGHPNNPGYVRVAQHFVEDVRALTAA